MAVQLPAWAVQAYNWGRSLQVPEQLMVATVDAESSGGQVLQGDFQPNNEPMAWGFGHVWLRWHLWALVKAAGDLGVWLPYKEWSAGTVNRTLGAIMIGDDRLNWYVTTLVVGYFWQASTRRVWKRGQVGTFDEVFNEFLHQYVGPAIPARDVTRRTDLLNYWATQIGIADPGGSGGGVGGGSGGGGGGGGGVGGGSGIGGGNRTEIEA